MPKALTVTDFFARFPTDDACLDHLMRVRFGETQVCPKCGREGRFARLRKMPAYACAWCGHHIHPMQGKPFERTRTPLQKWFYAMFLFTTTRNGVAAKELQRQLGVTYKTAWRMGHEIRKYMANVDGDFILGGHVEIDEAYIGGKQKGVGRVAKVGTVNVTAQFEIERYSHVMHISSNVEGEIDAARHDPLGALVAGFPAGTVSGAPKIRAMEIIDELEPTRRGVYAGTVGYFAADGSMDTCIALRTAVVKDGVMYVQAGGGIVADSDPEAEFQETRSKARALIRAAEEAVRFAARSG